MDVGFLLRRSPLYAGGIETHTLSLGRALAREGHTVTIYSSAPTPRETSAAQPLAPRLKLRPLGWGRISRDLGIMKCQLGKHDVLHLQGVDRGLFLSFALQEERCKRFITPHGAWFYTHSRPDDLLNASRILVDSVVFRRALREFGGVVALNSIELRDMTEVLGIPFSKVRVIPNGVPNEIFKLAQQVTRAPVNDGPYLLVLSRIHPRKHIEDIVAALPRLSPEIRLIVCGSDAGGQAKLRAISKAHRVMSRVVVMPPVRGDRKIELIVNSLCVVSASEFEMQPMSVLEAMACAVPPVVSAIDAHKELVRHRQSGLLFSRQNLGELVEHVESLAADPNLRKRLGAEARAAAERDFILERQIPKLVHFYETA